MKKYVVWLLVVVFSLSMALMGIGCKKTEVAATTAAVETTAAGETTAAPAKEEAVGEQKTIVYWSLWNETEPNAKVFQEYADKYHELHPEIDVKINFSGREVLANAMPFIAAGNKIDIMDNHSETMLGQVVDTGQALSYEELSKYLDGPDYNGNGTWKDTFNPGALDTYPGVIPYASYTVLFSINKAKWQEKGWAIPKTWDEFLALCEIIKNDGEMAPITNEFGAVQRNFTYTYMLLERIKGPGFLRSAVEDKTGKKWEDPAVRQVLEMVRELFDKGYFLGGEASQGLQAPQGEQLLSQGKAAMCLSGSWLPVEQKDSVLDPNWVWGAFPVPTVSGGVGSRNDNENFLIGAVVYKDSDVIPEAIDFLKFMTTVENAQKFEDIALSISPIKGTVPPESLSDVNDIMQNIDQSFMPYDGIRGYYPEYVESVLYKNHNPAFFGDITIDEFVKAMVKDSISYWETQ